MKTASARKPTIRSITRATTLSCWIRWHPHPIANGKAASTPHNSTGWCTISLQQIRARAVVVITHVPLITGYLAYGPKPDGTLRHDTVSVANSSDVTSLFAQHNILVVLQGHLHINEFVHYRNCQYACCGAVCGNWWHGPRLAFPRGLHTIVSLHERKNHVAIRNLRLQKRRPPPTNYKSNVSANHVGSCFCSFAVILPWAIAKRARGGPLLVS